MVLRDDSYSVLPDLATVAKGAGQTLSALSAAAILRAVRASSSGKAGAVRQPQRSSLPVMNQRAY
jgi:hypothetical protein